MEWIPWVNNIDKYCQCLGGTGFWTGREGTVQHLTFSLFSHSFPHPGIISSAPTSMMIICHLGNDPNVSCKWSLTIHPPSIQLWRLFRDLRKTANMMHFFANVFRVFLQMCFCFLQICSDFFCRCVPIFFLKMCLFAFQICSDFFLQMCWVFASVFWGFRPT